MAALRTAVARRMDTGVGCCDSGQPAALSSTCAQSPSSSCSILYTVSHALPASVCLSVRVSLRVCLRHFSASAGRRQRHAIMSASPLENKLPSIEDRGQTDRVTVLAHPNPNHNS